MADIVGDVTNKSQVLLGANSPPMAGTAYLQDE